MRKIKQIQATLALLFFFMIIFVLKWEDLLQPFFWDEVGVYGEWAYRLNNNIAEIIAPEACVGHPCGTVLIMVPFYKLFGASVFVAKCVTLCCSVVAMWMTFLIGRELLGVGAGFTAAIGLFSFEIFNATSTMFLADVVVTPFVLMYFFFAFKEKEYIAIVIGLFLGGARETTIAFGLALMAYYLLAGGRDFITAVTRRERQAVAKVITALSPFFSLGLFYLSQRITTGSFFSHPAFSEGHIAYRGWSNFISALINNLEMVFVPRNYFYYVVFLCASIFLVLLKMMFRRGKNKVNFSFLCFSLFVFVATFLFFIFLSFNSGVLARYFLPLLPFYFILMVAPIYFVVGRLIIILVPFFIILFYATFGGEETLYGTGHENDMQYRDVIKVHQMGIEYISKNFSGKKVFSIWPLFHLFTNPYYGYIKEPMTVVYQRDGSKRLEADGAFDVFMWANNADVKIAGGKNSFLEREGLRLRKRLEHKGKIVEIYEKR